MVRSGPGDAGAGSGSKPSASHAIPLLPPTGQRQRQYLSSGGTGKDSRRRWISFTFVYVALSRPVACIAHICFVFDGNIAPHAVAPHAETALHLRADWGRCSIAQHRDNRVQVETAPTPLRDHRSRLANPACDGLSIHIHSLGPSQYSAGVHLSQPPAFIPISPRPHGPISLFLQVSREIMLC